MGRKVIELTKFEQTVDEDVLRSALEDGAILRFHGRAITSLFKDRYMFVHKLFYNPLLAQAGRKETLYVLTNTVSGGRHLASIMTERDQLSISDIEFHTQHSDPNIIDLTKLWNDDIID